MTKVTRKIVLALMALLIMGACIDVDRLEDQFSNIDIDGNLSPSFVFPLINSTLTFKELTERTNTNTLIYIHNDSGDTTMCYMGFNDTLYIENPGLDFQIPSIDTTYQFAVPEASIPPVILPSGQEIGPFNFSEKYSFEPIEYCKIKRVELTQGVLNGHIYNGFQNTVSIHLSIESIKSKTTGQPFSKDYEINRLSQASIDLNLANYYFDLYDDVDSTYNTLAIDVQFSVISEGYQIQSADNIEMEIHLSDMDFSLISGPIYRTFYIGEQSIPVDIFQNTVDASLHLDQPQIKFTFKNSFGLPVLFNFPTFIARRGGETMPLHNTNIDENTLLIGDSYNTINYPTTYSNPLTPVSKVMELNYNNSNFVELVDFAPSDLLIDTYLQLGLPDDENDDYFISKDSDIQVYTEIEVPLYGYADFVLNSDTLEMLELPEIDFVNDYGIDSARITLKLAVDNGLPLGLQLQAYFVDSVGVTVDSLFTNKFNIDCANVDSNGEVVQNVKTESFVSISDQEYKKICKAKNIVLKVSVATGGTPVNGNRPTVVVRTNHSINFQMAFEISACVGQIPDL